MLFGTFCLCVRRALMLDVQGVIGSSPIPSTKDRNASCGLFVFLRPNRCRAFSDPGRGLYFAAGHSKITCEKVKPKGRPGGRPLEVSERKGAQV